MTRGKESGGETGWGCESFVACSFEYTTIFFSWFLRSWFESNSFRLDPIFFGCFVSSYFYHYSMWVSIYIYVCVHGMYVSCMNLIVFFCSYIFEGTSVCFACVFLPAFEKTNETRENTSVPPVVFSFFSPTLSLSYYLSLPSSHFLSLRNTQPPKWSQTTPVMVF